MILFNTDSKKKLKKQLINRTVIIILFSICLTIFCLLTIIFLKTSILSLILCIISSTIYGLLIDFYIKYQVINIRIFHFMKKISSKSPSIINCYYQKQLETITHQKNLFIILDLITIDGNNLHLYWSNYYELPEFKQNDVIQLSIVDRYIVGFNI